MYNMRNDGDIMAQEFKNFDKEFAHNRGKTFENICKSHGRPANSDWDRVCNFKDLIPNYDYAIGDARSIRNAVYFAPGARDWQFFRVGLHDLGTRQKLWCLAWYLSQEPKDYLRRIRVDNYLGALVRAKILDENLRILK